VAGDMPPKVKEEDKESFESVVRDFMELLVEVWKTCNKWTNKLWRRKKGPIATPKYEEKIESTRKKMETLLAQVSSALLSVMERHAAKSYAQILKELSDMRSLLSLINIRLDDIEESILQSEQNHYEILGSFAGLDVSFIGLERHIATLKNNEHGRLPVSMLPTAETLIGRVKIMEDLAKALRERGKKAALVGGAGMGKTSCAKKFAMDFISKDPKKRFVFWLSSETPVSLLNDYARALTRLRKSSGETTNDAEEKEVTLENLASDVWGRL
jgi:flagellar biosynthesis GTPase FlhF